MAVSWEAKRKPLDCNWRATHGGLFFFIHMKVDSFLAKISIPRWFVLIRLLSSVYLEDILSLLLWPCFPLRKCFARHGSTYITTCLWPSGLAQSVKNLPAMQETWAWSLGWEDPLEKERGSPFQYSCLGNCLDRGAWGDTVHRVAKSQSWLATTPPRVYHALRVFSNQQVKNQGG